MRRPPRPRYAAPAAWPEPASACVPGPPPIGPTQEHATVPRRLPARPGERSPRCSGRAARIRQGSAARCGSPRYGNRPGVSVLTAGWGTVACSAGGAIGNALSYRCSTPRRKRTRSRSRPVRPLLRSSCFAVAPVRLQHGPTRIPERIQKRLAPLQQMEPVVTMGVSPRRDAANRWAARHPILVGLVAGTLVTLAFLVPQGGLTASEMLIAFMPFSVLATLTALSERHRRKKHHLPL